MEIVPHLALVKNIPLKKKRRLNIRKMNLPKNLVAVHVARKIARRLPEAVHAKMPGVIVTLLLEINRCYEQGY